MTYWDVMRHTFKDESAEVLTDVEYNVLSIGGSPSSAIFRLVTWQVYITKSLRFSDIVRSVAGYGQISL